MIVAIDGPAGAGKSTVARAVARRMGAGYLDTGAMYRALTLLALRRGIDPDDGHSLARLADESPVELERLDGGALRVRIAGEDVTRPIRDDAVTANVSAVSAHGPVRQQMVARQRQILAEGDWVADGRDVGTAVAPDADVKVFLTATLDVRAERRARELGEGAELAEVYEAVRTRDQLDSTRVESPLRRAEDARVIDSTELTAEEVVRAVVELVESVRVAVDDMGRGP